MNNFLDRHHKYLRYLLVLSFITFVILGAATSVQGACLSIDAVTTGTTASNTDSSMTVSHTTGSDSDRLMLVAISVNVNDDERLATNDPVTYGGTPLTKVGERNNDNDAMVYIYSLVAPNPGTADVVITFDAALNYGALAGVMTFTGVHQTTPLGTFASAIGDDSTPASVDIPSAPGELVFAVVTDEYDAITTAPTGQDVHWNTLSDDNNYGAGGTLAGASPDVTMTWDLAGSSNNHWAIGGVSIKPASSKSLVMVTIDGTTTSDADDTSKRALFESWGWTVTAITDEAAQAIYDNAAANNDVMYISESAESSDVGTKATLLDIGIVVEENHTWDTMRFTTGSQDLEHTTILVSDNSHYITSVFSTGNMMIHSSQDSIGNMTAAGFASGGQSLATENNTGSPTLFVFNTGAALTSGTAPNRRVGIPTSQSSFSSWNADLKTIVQRSLDWASGCGVEGGGGSSCGTNLVMVTITGDFSASYDSAKKTLFEGWGWTVTAIDDLNGDYSGAASSNDVMFISESVTSGDVGIQARDLDIGIVLEEVALDDDMEFIVGSHSDTRPTGTQIDIVDNLHYITSTFSTGSLQIYNSSDQVTVNQQTLPSGAMVLAEEIGSSNTALTAFATGAALDGGITAANRRVHFISMHETNPSNWTSSMETLLQRSLDWAAGCGAAGGGTNSDPVLNSIGNKSVDEGQLLEFTISATDADGGDTLTYSASNLPTGATFTPATQTFSWTPAGGDAGTYPNVLFTVDDDGTPQGSDSEGITITVNATGGGVGTPINAGDVAGYSCNIKITIDNTKVAFTSENFPILISITDDSLKTSGCGFVTDPDGDDIVFTNSNLTLQLYHEIEKYDAATGELVAWVLVPSLSGSTDTDIYMYFGDSNVSSPTESPTDVWDSNYLAVWHLKEDPSGTAPQIKDSTSNANHGTSAGSMTSGDQVTGMIAGALEFDGSNDEIRFSSAMLGDRTAWTITAWMQTASDDQGIYSEGSLSTDDYLMIRKDSYVLEFYLENPPYYPYFDGGTLGSNFHHVAMVQTSKSNRASFVDGGSKTSNSDDAGTISFTTSSIGLVRTRTWNCCEFSGIIDEVRISNVARSDEWIETEYNNQNSPLSFYSYEVQCPETVPPISEFACSIPLTIDSSKVSGTSNLIDFPVLISLTNTSLRTTGSCGYVENSSGYDIIFSDATQTTILDHEIEKYDSASGELVAWVRVPTLSATSDTTIYIHYGHSSVCGATENPTGVWDSDYVGVWHLGDTSGDTQDSTSYNTDGTLSGTVTRGATGQIGDTFDFYTNGEVDWGDPTHLDFGTGEMTLSLWANIDQNRGAGVWEQIIMKGKSSYEAGYQLEIDDTANNLYFSINDDDGTSQWGRSASLSFSLDTWTHVVGVVDRTYNLLRIYKDGAQVNTSDISSIANIDVADAVTIGRDTNWPDARIDEVRLSNVARSADWIKTSYDNQSDPSSFYSVGASSCFLSGFSCNRRITIDSTKVEGSSDLTNFPFLLKIQNDCNLKTAANGGGVENSSGWDIIFMDSDGITQLDHEIEEYDGTTGDLTAWVRVPTLPYNSDKDIYMYYGKSGLTCDPSNPTGVWDSSYEAVYHLNGDVNDSTSNNRDGYNNNTGSYTAVIEEGRSFSPVDDFDIGTWGVSGQGLTMQTWARFDDFDQNDPRVFSKASSTSEQDHVFMLGLGGTGEQYLRMRLKTGTDDLSGTTTTVDTDDPLNDDTWYLIAGTYDGSNMRMLVDGVQIHSAAKTGNLRVNSWDIAIGNTPGGSSSSGYSLDGKLDEVRILSVARSADWLKTEYNNQGDPDSFYSMSQDTCGGTYGFNFQYCKKITVDHTQVSGDLTSYPLLINITGDDDLKTVANGGRVQHSQGWDIVFRTSGCGNYDHEIEKYDGANGDLVAWVQIPTLSSSTDTEIYMYYGATVICDTSNPTAVWDARFRAVYHLNDDFDDSTSNNRDGTNNGATFTASKIGNGALFDPSDGWDYIDLGTFSMSTDDATIQAWVWPNDFNQDDPRIVSKGSTTGSGTQDHVYQFGLENGDNGENRMRFRLKTGSDDLLNTIELEGTSPNGYLPTAQTWYHLAGTYEDDNSDGTEMRLYMNGLAAGQLGHAGNIRENSWPIWIGANPHGASNSAKTWDGILDEVRILSSDLSQDWLATEYRNHNDPGNFYSISSCFEQTTEVTQEWVEEVQ